MKTVTAEDVFQSKIDECGDCKDEYIVSPEEFEVLEHGPTVRLLGTKHNHDGTQTRCLSYHDRIFACIEQSEMP